MWAYQNFFFASQKPLQTFLEKSFTKNRWRQSEENLDKITKIAAGMDEKTTENLAELYGLITTVYKAKDIRTAEAAKVIENIQRDLNIALMSLFI